VSGYKRGEVRALIAPVFNQDPENIRHITITCQTGDGNTLFWDSAARGGDEEAHAVWAALNLTGVVQDILEGIARKDEPF
jgi:hypothetical protein